LSPGSSSDLKLLDAHSYVPVRGPKIHLAADAAAAALTDMQTPRKRKRDKT